MESQYENFEGGTEIRLLKGAGKRISVAHLVPHLQCTICKELRCYAGTTPIGQLPTCFWDLEKFLNACPVFNGVALNFKKGYHAANHGRLALTDNSN
ncbi:hypothetical protein D918_02190 [Trichuris suis]|nr:hypothetical protein D918_02190 [Trichuris suis]